MEPIDYTSGFQNPIQVLQSALSTGAGLAEASAAAQANRFKMEQAEAAAQRQKEIDAAFARLRRPGATSEDYLGLAMMLPKEQSDALRESFTALREEQRAAALSDTAQVFSALKANRPEIAVDLLRKQAEAERSSGNEDGAKFAESLALMVEAGEEGINSVRDLMGYTIATMPGGDKAIESINKIEQERRAEEEHPTLMAQKKADLAKATSDAEKAEIEARYAERLKELEVEADIAGIGLTGAQADEARARTRKLGAETEKLLLELEALKRAGGIPPEKKFEQEDKLRTEYVKRVQSYTDMKQTYDKMVASAEDPTGAGDIALVTGFMKMLDPGSVVRESEFATARDTGGLSAQLYALSQKYDPKTKGSFLKPEQKKAFLKLAGEYMAASAKHESGVRKDLGRVVESYGLSSDNVFGITPQPSDIKALRDFIKKSNPDANAAEIDGMTEEQLSARFPNGYAVYRKSVGATPASVEVDY